MKGLLDKPKRANAATLTDPKLAKVDGRLFEPIHSEKMFGKVAGNRMLDWEKMFEKKDTHSLYCTLFAWTMVWHNWAYHNVIQHQDAKNAGTGSRTEAQDELIG